ncbi:hypothetical protein MNBD_NITROSPINAE04-569 [hydrothermal vent metagenome]|uniref:Uncharacterized protein n=1 Tax=hydrothermal vent metagenome TaxID=652676 RepID=A0A3B1C8K9_9ZZZZ
MQDIASIGGSGGGSKKPAPAIQAQQDLQAKRDAVHTQERSKILEKATGTGLLGQKIGGMGNKVNVSA